MKRIVRYECSDGTVWPTAEQAELQDTKIAAVEAILAPLGPEPKLESGTFFRHSPEAVSAVRAAFNAAARKACPDWFSNQSEKYGNLDPDVSTANGASWIGRLLDGSKNPLEIACYRLCCVDAEGREWSQMYEAEHGGNGHDAAREVEPVHA